MSIFTFSPDPDAPASLVKMGEVSPKNPPQPYWGKLLGFGVALVGLAFLFNQADDPGPREITRIKGE
jgi:hypothetical protein